MGARPQQTGVIVDDQEHRDILYVSFEATFIFKAATEAGRFKEFQKTRYDAASDVHPAKGAKVLREVTAETPHYDAEQRQRPTAINTGIFQCAFSNIFRLQIFRQAAI